MKYMKHFDSLTEIQKLKVMEAYKTYRRIKNDEKLNIDILCDVDKKYEYLITHDNSFSASLRQLNNALFDATTSASFVSGLYSEKLLKSIQENGFAVMGAKRANFSNDKKMTKEHASGRNSVSINMLKHNGIYSFEEFVFILFDTCFVHYTTVAENQILSIYYQNNQVDDWLSGYEGAGINLSVPVFEGSGSKKKFIDYKVIPYDELKKNLKDNPYYYKDA